MVPTASSIKSLHLAAADGEIGHITDIFFEIPRERVKHAPECHTEDGLRLSRDL